MLDRSNIIYVYDGSFDGLLCCIFESFSKREVPINVIPDTEEQASLYQTIYIETIFSNANRVYNSLKKQLGHDGLIMLKTAFLCGYSEKSGVLFSFILLSYKYGPTTINMFTEDAVARTQSMAKSVSNENHLLLGFIRFSDYSGALVAVIEPKHMVLPLMKRHFPARYPEEHFMIYDKTHGMALIYKPYETTIIPISDFELPELDEREKEFIKLWGSYFEHIAIKERTNPICQRSHMPKRFWTHMSETQFKQQLQIAGSKNKAEQLAGTTASLRLF